MSTPRVVRSTLTVPASHPCLPGHFPGNPIVPAVVLLERVERALAAAVGPVSLSGLPTVKFVSPLQPDREFEIELSIDEAARTARFRCSSAGRDLVQGRLEYRPAT